MPFGEQEGIIHIITFIEKRLAEGDLPPKAHESYRTIMRLALKIRHDGEDNDWLSWIGASEVVKAGEYLLDIDPASDAEHLSNQLLAALASTWSDHPDFDESWTIDLLK